MEQAAATRKEKLIALRKRKADEDAGLVPRGPVSLRAGELADGDEEMDQGLLVKRSFRNYDPTSRQFKKTAAGKDIEDTVEKAVHGVQEAIIAQDEIKRNEELDLLNIAPKRPNWDLKRDLNKRLAKLERRDKEAVLILIRQRIAAQRDSAGAARDGATAGLDAATAEMAAGATMQRGAGRIGTQYDDDEDEEEEDE